MKNKFTPENISAIIIAISTIGILLFTLATIWEINLIEIKAFNIKMLFTFIVTGFISIMVFKFSDS